MCTNFEDTTCEQYYACCDCGQRDDGLSDFTGCGCRYCWDCNACDACWGE